MKHTFKPWHLLPLVLLVIGIAFTMTSCGDDEPSGTVIDYYLKVEEGFLVDGSAEKAKSFVSPVDRMREVIRSVYPTPNAQGADEAVLAACEQEYAQYCSTYAGLSGNAQITCIFDLMRVVKKGSQIQQSETLRKFVYAINSTPTDIED